MKTAETGARAGRENRNADHRVSSENNSGFVEENTPCLKADEGTTQREEAEPAAWMTPSLIRRTREVWSKEYGRPLDRREAMEILRNVRWFGEILRRWMQGGLTT